MYEYKDVNGDETYLHNIDPYITHLRESIISKVRVSAVSTHDNTRDLLTRRTYVSTDRYSQVTTEN